MSLRLIIAVPVLNEEAVLERTVRQMAAAAAGLRDVDAEVVIVDNGSDDATPEIGRRLADEVPSVRYVRIGERGKGRAIRHAWSGADADVYAFMDADLATDLSALPALVEGAANDGVAYGSRFHPDAVVERSFLRRAFSSGYRAAVRVLLATSVNDAPCGFKAVSRRVVRDVLPEVRDDRWFFDTELVVRAERAGVPVVEVPVAWKEHEVEGRRSKVNALGLSVEYLRHILRLRKDLR